jgi:hypothetical protein
MEKSNDPVRIMIDLLKLLMSPSPDSKIIIRYMEQHEIDNDIYLPSMRGKSQMPLIYYCCSSVHLSEFFAYLVSGGVNLSHSMICEDPTQNIELLYYSQIQYIPLLIENGCRLNPAKIAECAERMVINGNITKLITLYKYGAIVKDQMTPVLQKQGIIFRILDQLYNKVYNISQQCTNNEKFAKIYDELLKNYVNTFKFFFKNGVNINQIENGESFVQKVFNTYFIPMIQFVIDCHPHLDSEDFLHYSNFDLGNRQVMKFVYTEKNYQIINGIVADKMKPKKIVIKKNLIKKVVQIPQP